MNNRKAFTLVEVIVILAVVAILAAIAVPLALRIFQSTATDATATQMQNLQNAMIGNPTKLNGTVRADFGFLGDIGCFPTTALGGLNRLLTNPGGNYPGWVFNSAKQAGAGWNGPYIAQPTTGQATAGVTIDGWGNTYTYSPAAGACPLTARLTSNGPDGVFSTSDDIVFSMAAAQTTATTVRGVLKISAGDRIPSAPVDINYPVNGTLTTSTATTDTNGVYTFSSIPYGKRSVQPRPTLVYAPNSGFSEAGSGGLSIQFTIFNMSSSAVTFTSLVATYNSPGNCYGEVWFNGTPVFTAGPCSGDTATCPGVTCTIAASSSAPPAQVVVIDDNDIQLPDLIVFPQGTSALIELLNFNNASVIGIPFTITFNLSGGGSAVVRFTPANGG